MFIVLESFFLLYLRPSATAAFRQANGRRVRTPLKGAPTQKRKTKYNFPLAPSATLSWRLGPGRKQVGGSSP